MIFIPLLISVSKAEEEDIEKQNGGAVETKKQKEVRRIKKKRRDEGERIKKEKEEKLRAVWARRKKECEKESISRSNSVQLNLKQCVCVSV